MKRVAVKNTDGTTSFDFLCSAEWHLSRSGSMYAAVIYGFAQKLSKQTGRFNASIPKLAEYFHADDRAIRKAIKKLVRSGFFVKLRAVPGSSVAYRPVPHKEWANKNPNCCLEMIKNPWSDEEKDALAIWLYAASDRTMKCFPNFMVAIRKTGHSEEAVRQHFQVFYAEDGNEKKGRFKRFLQHLREQPVQPLSKAASV